ncbi:flavin-dependent oxidoreductase [Tsukamurella soli]|uniref:Flavin-dependent oxidoreductase n=1 Tax=Tsukamurella soli TaxID=644556 RepID=A0ABP8JKE6_9ACTN
MKVLIGGAGIGGLALALSLHHRFDDIDIQLYDAAPEFRPLGLGINLMPHAVRVLAELGLRSRLAHVAVEAKEFAFYTSRGQQIHTEATGIDAGYAYPHFSIHRGDLHSVLHRAVVERIGAERVHTGHRLADFAQDEAGVAARFVDAEGHTVAMATGDVLIGADGLHSAVRKAFYPDEGEPLFHGINMWRGVTRGAPFLSGASATRVGALHRTGKLVVYPIRDDIDGNGTQLINWVVEVVTDAASPTDWSAPGRLEDFIDLFAGWKFDWLDVERLVRDADIILSYPMADRDPVDRWTFGRVTLLGDAAHPMYPRGGNGAAQAILDAEALAACLATTSDPFTALAEYESERLPIVNKIVLTNRETPPDALIEEVERRTGGGTFERIDDVISTAEIEAFTKGYQVVAGYDLETVANKGRT